MNIRQNMVNGLLAISGQAGDSDSYIPVEWLASKGAAKINTGVPGANDNLKIECRFKYSSWSRYRYVFGSYTNEQTNATRLILRSEDNDGMFTYMNTRATSPTYIDNATKGVWHDFSLTKTTATLDGVEMAMNQTAGTTAAQTAMIQLFNGNGTTDTECTVYISAFKIYDSSYLIRDFQPVVRFRDMKPGMLDKVSGTFYGNAGTGEFTYDMPSYADSPDLWIEADSAGSTAWTNKGVGSYDLLPYTNHNPVIDGSAITASSGHLLQLYTHRNVVGTGSFTIDAVVRPSSALVSTTHGGWLYEQRTDNTAQAGSIQCVFSNTRKYSLGGWGPGGASILSGVTAPVYVPDRIQYAVAGYDADNKRLWMQLDDASVERNELTFSCTIPRFEIGFTMWNTNVPFMGSLYSIRVYNRVLTAQELAYNRARDRLRFNF